MRLSRKEELLITIQGSLDFIENDISSLMNENLLDPLEELVFEYFRQDILKTKEDFQKLTKAIHRNKNQDLSND